jgi:hypothetical protein
MLGKTVIPVLGTWHVFKFGCEAVWKKFGPMFIAPAWHHLWPDATVKQRPQVRHIGQFFIRLMHAYPSFRPKLLTALREAKEPGRPNRRVRQSNLLQNLVHLLDIFIPTVRAIVT